MRSEPGIIKGVTDLAGGEARFRALFEASPDAIFVEGFDGVVLDVNPAACRLHRCGRGDLVGKGVGDLVPPDLREEVEADFRRWTTGELTEWEGWSWTRDGRRVPVEIRGCHVEFGGRDAVLRVVRDVSGRKRGLEELRAAKEYAENLVRSANIIIVGLDREGRVEVFNRRAEEVTGYARSDVEGRDWFEAIVPRSVYPAAWEAFRSLRVGPEPRLFEGVVLARSGEERRVTWSTSRMFEEGELKSIYLFGVDITDLRREESKRRALEQRMLEAQKMESLGLLAGGVAHDFNNLLTTILGNAALVREGVGRNSEAAPFLMEIDRAVAHAADLCRQLLAYSGRGRIEKKPVDLGRIVGEMKHLLEVSVGKNVRLEIAAGEGVGAIEADATQIRQVVMNLVINASEAIGARGGTVRVRTVEREVNRVEMGQCLIGAGLPGGKMVELVVSDDGSGMLDEVRARVFEPFFSTKVAGRGLGLAAVAGIVRSHGAAAAIQSGLGEGTTFRIFFKPAAERSAEQAGPEPAGVEWRAEGRALFVDDEESVRMVGSRILESFGFEVASARDGVEGCERFEADPGGYAVVVLDITMPRMDGREAYRRIRAIRPEVPVLFISGFANALEGVEMGGRTDFLAKPFRIGEIRARLMRLLGAEEVGG